jgi:hypothetical protein
VHNSPPPEEEARSVANVITKWTPARTSSSTKNSCARENHKHTNFEHREKAKQQHKQIVRLRQTAAQTTAHARTRGTSGPMANCWYSVSGMTQFWPDEFCGAKSSTPILVLAKTRTRHKEHQLEGQWE